MRSYYQRLGRTQQKIAKFTKIARNMPSKRKCVHTIRYFPLHQRRCCWRLYLCESELRKGTGEGRRKSLYWISAACLSNWKVGSSRCCCIELYLVKRKFRGGRTTLYSYIVLGMRTPTYMGNWKQLQFTPNIRLLCCIGQFQLEPNPRSHPYWLEHLKFGFHFLLIAFHRIGWGCKGNKYLLLCLFVRPVLASAGRSADHNL